MAKPLITTARPASLLRDAGAQQGLLPDPPGIEATRGSNAPELTVSELSSALKRTVEDRFGFVRLRGEVSNYRGPHSSGHAYFCLKDENARIDAVVWKTTLARMRVKPEEGLEVVATGKITTFPGKSSYQIVVETLEPAGIGALMALLEDRRRRLAAEGLFDAARKRALPYLPHVIGVVTSPTGAVIRDILHRVNARFPRHVLVWPVRVQGDASAAEVAAAIRGLNALLDDDGPPRPHLIIVARGGGSLEDLWGYNDEAVVRAVADSLIPLISAVGHETDWTLIDHVADLRAPTPTGAAEMALPVLAELASSVAQLRSRQGGAVLRRLDEARAWLRSTTRLLPSGLALLASPRQRFDRATAALPRAARLAADRDRLLLARLSRRLGAQSPQARLARDGQRFVALAARLARFRREGAHARTSRLQAAATRLETAFEGRIRLLSVQTGHDRERLARLAQRLDRASAGGLSQRRARVGSLTQLLGGLSYRSVLARGFAVVRGPDGSAVRTADAARRAETLSIEFADDHLPVQVLEAPRSSTSTSSRVTPGRKRSPAADDRPAQAQGTLFDS